MIWGGLGVLMALMLWGAGCSRTPSEYSQLPPNAEGLFLTGVRASGGDSARLLHNARYLKMMGRQDLALRELEAAYQQDPGNIKVLNALALACEEMGDFTRAQKIYQQALAQDASNQALNNNLCFSYYLAGQWDKAETCFRQALKKNPQNFMARNNLGLLLCRRGRSEEAYRLWKDAEGQAAAEKKMQQVQVALGLADSSHYAQTPQAAPAASTPVPAAPSPAPVAPTAAPAKVVLTNSPASQSQVPATPPAKAKEPVKKEVVKFVSTAAAPAKKTATPVAAAKPEAKQPQKTAAAAQPAPAAPQKKPTHLVLARAPVQAETPPALPKRTAAQDKKASAAKSAKTKVSAAAPAKGPAPAKRLQSGIELANGSGAKNLARRTRTLLKKEGYKVVSIGNYRDFGAENTIIYYRPEAEKVARALSAKLFPQAYLEVGKKFAKNANIKVLLGKDLLPAPSQDHKSTITAPKVAAGVGSHPEKAPQKVAQAQTPKTPPAKTKAAPTLAASVPAGPKPYLTAEELTSSPIEIRNGTGAKNLAHKARSMLSEEGFYVTVIGNHYDFGADKTIIYYRPGSEKIARNLQGKFFSNSTVQKSTKLHGEVAVKVLLGKDLLQRTDVMAKLDN